MDRFEITYYWGPHGEQATEERFWKAVAEAGFTSVPLENNSYENNLKALSFLKKYGLTCSGLWDRRVYELIASLGDSVPDEDIDRVTKEVADSYADYADVIKGWWMADEPSVGRFRVLGRIRASFARTDPGRTVMINLFPTYASSEQLGAPDYETYLKEFTDTVKPHYLSYDHYHFRKGGDRVGFFTNIEAIRKHALESGLDPMSIILLTCHMGYSDVTYEQLSWEVGVSLAYGMKRISYFTFILEQNLLDDGWTDGCMSYKGEVYPHYYDVQKISKWLRPLGDELFGKKSAAVFHVGGDPEPGTVSYSGYGTLGRVCGKAYLVGFFDDGSFLLVNKNTDASAGENALVLCDVSSGLEYFDTSDACWKPADAGCPAVRRDASGAFTAVLPSGASMLFRIKESS